MNDTKSHHEHDPSLGSQIFRHAQKGKERYFVARRNIDGMNLIESVFLCRNTSFEIGILLVKRFLKENFMELLEGNNLDVLFNEKVIQAGAPVIVEFYRTNSGSSFLVHDIIYKFQRYYGDKFHFYRINIDEHSYFEQLYGIQEIPTILLFINGTIRGYITGTFSSEKFKEYILDNII